MYNQIYDGVSDKFSNRVCKILEFYFDIKVKFGVMEKIDLSPGKVLEVCFWNRVQTMCLYLLTFGMIACSRHPECKWGTISNNKYCNSGRGAKI